MGRHAQGAWGLSEWKRHPQTLTKTRLNRQALGHSTWLPRRGGTHTDKGKAAGGRGGLLQARGVGGSEKWDGAKGRSDTPRAAQPETPRPAPAPCPGTDGLGLTPAQPRTPTQLGRTPVVSQDWEGVSRQLSEGPCAHPSTCPDWCVPAGSWHAGGRWQEATTSHCRAGGAGEPHPR